MKLRTLRRNLQTQLESRWMRLRSRFIDIEKLTEQVEETQSFGIVLVTDNQAEPDSAAVESIQNQLYRNHSLCLASESTAMEVATRLSKDHSYVAFLDRKVVLEPDALLWAAIELNKQPQQPDWIYFDHVEEIDQHRMGVVDRDGSWREARYHRTPTTNRTTAATSAVFKPDFSPEYLLAGMFAGGFNLFRSEVLRDILRNDGQPIDTSCLQYEIALRISSQSSLARITHITQIAFSHHSKPSADEIESQRQAATRHLQRQNTPARVDVVCHEPPVFSPYFETGQNDEITVLIPTRNQFERVKKCVDGVRATTGDNVHIRMIDNQSDCRELFDYYRFQESLGRFDVESFNEPFNYARMHNVAVEKLESEFVLLLNNDVLDFSEGWVEQLVSTSRLSDDIGCVGALLRYPDGKTQHGGVSFGIGRPCRHIHLDMLADAPGYCGRQQAIQQLSALTAALLLLRRDIFNQLGGFDEERYPISYNDTDLCLKMRTAGYRSIYNPRVTAVHEESVSRGKSPLEKKWRAQFIQQWAGEIESDPFYNPHLSKREYAVDAAAFQAWQERKRVTLESAIRAA